jgi:hypothetical protein
MLTQNNSASPQGIADHIGDPNMNMKAMILAAIAALSLGVGAAYAQSAPAGFQPPVYGPSDSGH